jgi:hypothetical protein
VGGLQAVQNISIQRAGELPEAVKSAVEQLLGRPIEADEEVSIAALPPQHVPPIRNREEIARKLADFLDRRADKLTDVSDEEIDAAIDEAANQVRHSPR